MCEINIGVQRSGCGARKVRTDLEQTRVHKQDSCVRHSKAETLLQNILHRNVLWYRGGLVFKAHRLLYRSTLGLRVIKKKKQVRHSKAETLLQKIRALPRPRSSAAVSQRDRLRVGWLNRFLGGVPREQKMLKGHLPRVIYHQVY